MGTQATVRCIPADELVAGLRRFPAAAFEETAEIREFLRAHPVQPESLERYLFWDRQHYTRNLIDKTPLYELIAVCWDMGQYSSIHNHHQQNCWMAAPIGRLKVQNYRTLLEDLEGGRCRIEPSDELEINPLNPTAVDPRQPVHRVINPKEFGQRAVTLHVYSRPFDHCVVYSQEQGTCGEIELHYTSEYGVANQQWAGDRFNHS